ncbi:MAG: tetratricopeptide repeat protein [Candidatus Obscuribacterales bacterium]|nr:tetratricopeptide repeat protein [Candidatus Obscuribacterales bacterium]
MNFKMLGIPGKLLVLTAFLPLLSISLSLPANAQGIAEYGGLMEMPRNIPTSHSQKTLNNLYGGAARNLSRTAPSAGSVGSAGGAGQAGAAGGGTGENLGQVMKLGQQAQIDLTQARKLSSEKKFDQAIALYRKSLAVREKFWAGRDPLTPEIYKEMAEIYAGQSKPEDAEEALKNSIASYAKLHGPGSKHTSVPLKRLGDIYDKRGEHWKSHDAYLQSFMLTERYEGENSKPAMELRLKMARKAVDLEKYSKAADFYKKAIELDQENDILTAEEQVKVLTEYVSVLRKLKRDAEADKLESAINAAS